MMRLAAALTLLTGAATAQNSEPDIPSWFPVIISAEYDLPIDHYGHWVLGRGRGEWARLSINGSMDGRAAGFAFVGPQTPESDNYLFEGPAPLVADVTGDGLPEVIATETDPARGARLSIYGWRQYDLEGPLDIEGGEYPFDRLAATPPIGEPYRWLAVIGAADLDGDGHIEVAFVDRPHLAKVLRIWRYRDGEFREVAAAEGFTNHRIGEPDIAGGVRDCGQGPEMIVASADWSRLLAVRYDGAFRVREIGRDTSRPAFARAKACR